MDLDDLIHQPAVIRSDEGNHEPIRPGAGLIGQGQIGPHPAVVEEADVRERRDGKPLPVRQRFNLALLTTAHGIDVALQVLAQRIGRNAIDERPPQVAIAFDDISARKSPALRQATTACVLAVTPAMVSASAAGPSGAIEERPGLSVASADTSVAKSTMIERCGSG